MNTVSSKEDIFSLFFAYPKIINDVADLEVINYIFGSLNIAQSSSEV